MEIGATATLSYFFFLKKLKWNILPKKSVPPSTRCTKEETQSLNNIYKGNEKIYKKERNY